MNTLKQKESHSVIPRTVGNPPSPTKVQKKLASIAVHGAETLQGNGLQAVVAA